MSSEELTRNVVNLQVCDTAVSQNESIDDRKNNSTVQEFDVNAHGHKPNQISNLSVDMGDSTDGQKQGATNTGNISKEDQDSDIAGLANSNPVNTVQNIEGETDLLLAGGHNLLSSDQTNRVNQNEKELGFECANRSESEKSSVCEYKEISSEDDDADDEPEDLTEKAEGDSSTSSPSQISPDHHTVKATTDYSLTKDSEDDSNPERPGSLSLPRPLQYVEKQKYLKYHKRGKSDSSFASDVSRSSSTDVLIEEASKTPLSSKGTVTKDGDMIAFVAEGLNDLIKLSSPLSQTDSSMSSSLRSPGEKSVSSVSSSTSAWSDVTSSASEWSRDYSRMSRSPSILTASPDDIPPVDPRAVMDLEMHAVKVASSVDHMMGTLKNNLYKMSALSYHCLDAHKDAVDSTCDTVDSSIKNMYALMAKCEELSKSMKPIYALHTQVKEIERLLTLFEGQLAKEEK